MGEAQPLGKTNAMLPDAADVLFVFGQQWWWYPLATQRTMAGTVYMPRQGAATQSPVLSAKNR